MESLNHFIKPRNESIFNTDLSSNFRRNTLFLVGGFSNYCFAEMRWENPPGQQLELDMKYHILHDLRTSTPVKEKSSDNLKEFDKFD